MYMQAMMPSLREGGRWVQEAKEDRAGLRGVRGGGRNEGGGSDAGSGREEKEEEEEEEEEKEVLMVAVTNLYVMHPLVISKVNTAAVTQHHQTLYRVRWCVLAPAATARQSWGKQLPTTDA